MTNGHDSYVWRVYSQKVNRVGKTTPKGGIAGEKWRLSKTNLFKTRTVRVTLPRLMIRRLTSADNNRPTDQENEALLR